MARCYRALIEITAKNMKNTSAVSNISCSNFLVFYQAAPSRVRAKSRLKTFSSGYSKFKTEPDTTDDVGTTK